MDAEMAKQFQKMLGKQGIKFKLSTKVVSGKVENDKVVLEVDAAKGGKPETVSPKESCLTNSWKQISVLCPSADVPTPRISTSKPSVSRKIRKVVSSSTLNTVPHILTSVVSAT